MLRALSQQQLGVCFAARPRRITDADFVLLEASCVPLLVKAKYFSKDAEKKIKAVGGACQLVA